jgi:hypothetical protein
MHLVPVPINVRCYSNSNPIVRRSEVTLRARNRLLHRDKFGEVQRVKSGLLQQDGGAKRPFSKVVVRRATRRAAS